MDEQTKNILPENTIPTSNSRLWKVWTLGIASLLLQTLTWYSLQHTLIVNPSTINWVWLAVIAACTISITAFFHLINKSRIFADILILLSAVSYFFLSPHNLYVWIGGLIFALFAFWYEERLRREAASRVDFSVTRVIGSSVSILIYAILLLLAFNIYNNVATDFKAHPDKFYNRLGNQAAKTVPYFTKIIIPGDVNLNQPLGDYLQKQVQVGPQYQNASAIERQILINEAKIAFQNQFQITASNSDTLSDVMAQVVVGKIRQAVEPHQDYLPIVFTILIVGVLYTFAFLIRWSILLISWILFQVLKAVGFFRLEKVQVEVEKLVI